jgi:hypothetical protein
MVQSRRVVTTTLTPPRSRFVHCRFEPKKIPTDILMLINRNAGGPNQAVSPRSDDIRNSMLCTPGAQTQA